VLQIIYTHVDQIMFVMSLSPWSDKEEKEKNKNICFHHVDLSTWHDRSPWHTDIITCTPSIVWTWPFGLDAYFLCSVNHPTDSPLTQQNLLIEATKVALKLSAFFYFTFGCLIIRSSSPLGKPWKKGQKKWPIFLLFNRLHKCKPTLEGMTDNFLTRFTNLI